MVPVSTKAKILYWLCPNVRIHAPHVAKKDALAHVYQRPF